MKNIFRNRTFLGISCIVISLFICLVAAPAFSSASGKQVEIVRVKQRIQENTQINKDMVESVKVGGYNLPSNTITKIDDVVGKYTTATLQPGDNILSTKISEQSPNEYLSKLDGKRVAVSISIKSFAAGVSGKLQTGDIISLDVADYGDLKQTLAPEELRYVKLIAATNDTGIDNSSDQAEKEKSKEEDMPSTLTVLVTPAQAQKLVDYENNGRLHAALVYRGSKDTAQKFLDMQDQYLKTQEGGTSNEN